MILNEQKVAIVEQFILDTEIKITATEIAKERSLNQKSVYLFMEELQHQNILTSSMQGRNKLYKLNKMNKEIVQHFLCAVEHLRTLYFYQRHNEIKQIIQKILSFIEDIAIIFGSYADNKEKKDSDIDLFIVGKYDQKEIEQIIKTHNVDIQIKYYKEYKEDTLTREIKKKHIILKGTEQFVREVQFNG